METSIEKFQLFWPLHNPPKFSFLWSCCQILKFSICLDTKAFVCSYEKLLPRELSVLYGISCSALSIERLMYSRQTILFLLFHFLIGVTNSTFLSLNFYILEHRHFSLRFYAYLAKIISVLKLLSRNYLAFEVECNVNAN
jgi:hypothetical protein